jgi:phenylacetate-coenzyme A ligase PaaK-like adenylate-forming protein
MFETGVRHVRMAVGMVSGRRLNTRNLAKLVGDALVTLAEFGEPGADADTLLGAPIPDPEEQREFVTRCLRRTARRLAVRSPFYARRLAAAAIEPRQLDAETLRALPVTIKRDLIERPGDFLCTDVERYLTTRTTGTTGRPAEIWLSRYEMDLWSALGALGALLRDELRPSDIMQVNISSRAVAATHLSAAVCRLTQTGCRLLGITAPDDAVDNLAGGAATILSTYPSYLAELVKAARRRGMGPGDFKLRRITVGGEVLSPSVAQAACSMFGVPQIVDSFSMTEVIPVTANTCSQRHVHHDVATGMTEVLDLRTGEPAAPGSLGTIVITPFFPYRDCMPVLRYDTRDVVRCLPDEPLGCELAGFPATSQILGKADSLVHVGADGVVTPRELIDAIEALPAEPWPARYVAADVGGKLKLTLPAAAVAGFGEAAAQRHFAEAGLDVDLAIVSDDQAAPLRRTRSDLHETSFGATHALIGA